MGPLDLEIKISAEIYGCEGLLVDEHADVPLREALDPAARGALNDCLTVAFRTIANNVTRRINKHFKEPEVAAKESEDTPEGFRRDIIKLDNNTPEARSQALNPRQPPPGPVFDDYPQTLPPKPEVPKTPAS